MVRPAVERLQAEGIDARGPLPADTMFHAAARATYDVALAMYHDQALIPIKTLAFDHAVNVTLGLPFVRTSPDHGTAFDIAGTGRADPSSLIAALQLAARFGATNRAVARGHERHRRSSAAARGDPPTRPHAKKSLGQNFLLDLNLTGAHRARGRPARGRDRGRGRPGPGRAHARAARRRAARVIAIERDERAIAALAEIAARYPGRLDVIAGDALDFDPRSYLDGDRRASSPTCPTTSRPRCWSAGSRPSRGRPGTTGWC